MALESSTVQPLGSPYGRLIVLLPRKTEAARVEPPSPSVLCPTLASSKPSSSMTRGFFRGATFRRWNRQISAMCKWEMPRHVAHLCNELLLFSPHPVGRMHVL